MIIVLLNWISALLWIPVCYYVMLIISLSLLLYYIILSLIFSLEVFLSAQTVCTFYYSQQSSYKVETCCQVWSLKCIDAFREHKHQTAWSFDYFTVCFSLNEQFVSHFWHNVIVSACVHARGFWIYLHLTERREWRDAAEPACVWSHNQHLHVCECVKEWHRETKLSAIR